MEIKRGMGFHASIKSHPSLYLSLHESRTLDRTKCLCLLNISKIQLDSIAILCQYGWCTIVQRYAISQITYNDIPTQVSFKAAAWLLLILSLQMCIRDSLQLQEVLRIVSVHKTQILRQDLIKNESSKCGFNSAGNHFLSLIHIYPYWSPLW